MTRSTVLLDPTAEREPARRLPTPRPGTIKGLKVGLLDISKPRGDIFLEEVAQALRAEGATVQLYRKPTYTRVAPASLQQQIASECDVVIEALAD